MIIVNLPPQQEPQPPEIPPRRRRLMQDLANIETIFRAIDLHELQDGIDEQIALFPEWSKTASPIQQRSMVYAISAQQIVLLAAVELLRARKELPFPQHQT